MKLNQQIVVIPQHQPPREFISSLLSLKKINFNLICSILKSTALSPPNHLTLKLAKMAPNPSEMLRRIKQVAKQAVAYYWLSHIW